MLARNFKIALTFALLFTLQLSFSQAKKVVVEVDKPTAKIQPTMWGLFFEDINFAADGGLYAELVKNRSFEFPNPKTGWEFPGQNLFASNLVFINRGEEFSNMRYAHLSLDEKYPSTTIVNTGFRGIGIKEGEVYRFSIQLAIPGNDDIMLSVELLDDDDNTIAIGALRPQGIHS